MPGGGNEGIICEFCEVWRFQRKNCRNYIRCRIFNISSWQNLWTIFLSRFIINHSSTIVFFLISLLFWAFNDSNFVDRKHWRKEENFFNNKFNDLSAGKSKIRNTISLRLSFTFRQNPTFCSSHYDLHLLQNYLIFSHKARFTIFIVTQKFKVSIDKKYNFYFENSALLHTKIFTLILFEFDRKTFVIFNYFHSFVVSTFYLTVSDELLNATGKSQFHFVTCFCFSILQFICMCWSFVSCSRLRIREESFGGKMRTWIFSCLQTQRKAYFCYC